MELLRGEEAWSTVKTKKSTKTKKADNETAESANESEPTASQASSPRSNSICSSSERDDAFQVSILAAGAGTSGRLVLGVVASKVSRGWTATKSPFELLLLLELPLMPLLLLVQTDWSGCEMDFTKADPSLAGRPSEIRASLLWASSLTCLSFSDSARRAFSASIFCRFWPCWPLPDSDSYKSGGGQPSG